MNLPGSSRARRIRLPIGAGICGLASAGLLASACTTPPAHSGDSPQNTPQTDLPLRPGQPGEREPGSLLRLPARAKAGSPIDGRVPVGSEVEAFGQRLAPSADGRITLMAPERPGIYMIRILRADTRPPIPLRIEVTAD